MVELLVVVHFLGFASCLVVAAYLHAYESGAAANRALRLLMACGAAWSLLELFLHIPASAGLELEVIRLEGIFHLSGPFCFVHFAYALGGRRRDAAWKLLAAATLAVIGVYGLTDLGAASAVRGPDGFVRSEGESARIFDALEGLGHMYALWVMYRGFEGAREPMLRKSFLVLTVGLVAADAIGVTAELIADPWTTGISFRSAGIPAYIPFLGVAILKHGFLSADIIKAAVGLFGDAKDGIVILDRYDRVRQLNAAALRVLDLRPEEAAGRRAAELAPEWSGIAGSDKGELEFERAGERRARLAVSWSSPERRGQRLGRIILVRDVTPRMRAKEALARSREELGVEVERRTAELKVAQRAEAMGALTGSIAHDFNNILAAIIGFATAARDDLPEHHSIRRDVDEILAAARRARGTVDQLLTLGQQGVSRRTPLKLGELVDSTLSFVRTSLPVTIDLVRSGRPGDLHVMGDKTQLEQVIVNLTTSAAQAIGARKGAIAVRVSTASPGGPRSPFDPEETAVVEVTDDGPEIGRGELDNLFDPFVSKGAREGTGLGLPVAQRIVRDHGGTITVESGEGRGTTFSVFLPLISPRVAAAAHEHPLDTGSERILLVDGAPESSRETRRTLVSLGYRVTEHADPLDAVSEFRRKPGAFDAVIVHVELPGSSGLDVAAEIREERSDTPILLVAALADPGSMRAAERLGVAGIVEKPLTPGTLSKAVRRALDAAAGRGAQQEPA